MAPELATTRRRFLHQTLVFSAASAFLSPLVACGSGGTAPTPANENAHLLMVGDWGTNNSDQSTVAAAMQAYVASHKLPIQALLMLGDNFYQPLGSTSSPLWSQQFESMYPASVFNCPAYALPGNHDYIEDDGILRYDVQLEYAKTMKTRWMMPSQYYRVTFPAPNPLVTMIVLDSNVPFQDGSTKQGPFLTMTDAQRQAQLDWLTAELQKPLETPFLVIVGHHPLYSDGPHGDNATLIRDWDPLFRANNVHAYFAGHDHDLQHLEFAGHPTSFFCSGGGGAGLYNLLTPEATRGPYAKKVFGFSHLEVMPTLMTLRHIDENGVILHAFTKTRDNQVAIFG